MSTPAPADIFFRPTNWLDPFAWESVFGNDRPVEVDVGAGKGSFLLWAAATQLQHNFLGIERLLLRLRKVNKKACRQGLTNVRLIRLEASYLIGKLIPPSSVAAYHIYFPDPWPKRRHQHHRLFNAVFAGDVLRTLRPGGFLNVATDHEEYFRQIQAVMLPVKECAVCPVVSLPVEAQTDFEKEFLAAGTPIHRGRWQKR
jgi:tRNA (guanine-N7-)-methyltransferase